MGMGTALVIQGDLLDCQEPVRALQSPYGHLAPRFFPLSFWLAYCLSQLLFADTGGHKIKALLLTVFNKCPQGKSFLYSLSSSSLAIGGFF